MNKYLHTYAEPECAALETFPSLSLRHVLVIPCFRETTEFALRFRSGFSAESDILIIVVINQPGGIEEPANRELMAFFQDFPTIWRHENLSLFRSPDHSLHWLVVDRFSLGRTIDKKLGVGLARKLGCDLAAALIAEGHCSASWICTTDADATLPTNYFAALNSCPADAVAAVFSVKHVASAGEDEELLAATARYETALRYYVDGLAWAGSPYAFPTIGSALAVRMQAYCECRGFPRKAGGEDFYLLNKLAKMGRVHWLKNVSISVSARISDRVPFGTGPAVKRILDLTDPADFRYYAPDTFIELRLWLSCIPQIWQKIHCNREPLENLPTHIQSVLNEAGIHTLWAHIRRQVSTQNQCERAIHHWFDAFQTLKFIRRLQELRYPALPLDQCLQLAPIYQETDSSYLETKPCRTL